MTLLYLRHSWGPRQRGGGARYLSRTPGRPIMSAKDRKGLPSAAERVRLYRKRWPRGTRCVGAHDRNFQVSHSRPLASDWATLVERASGHLRQAGSKSFDHAKVSRRDLDSGANQAS
jgi:hypothetical protein